jgi:hypothetical protein
MLVVNTHELTRGSVHERRLWKRLITEVNHGSWNVSDDLVERVRLKHRSDGHGDMPTYESVYKSLQAMEAEGMFGLGT